MFKKSKQLIIGILIGALLFGAIPVMATTGIKELKAFYNNIKISVNGKEIKTDIEPFIVDGRTYVPVRVVSEALGVDVNWNDKTNTVEIGKVSQKEVEKPTITYQGFNDSGTDISYVVIFSDEFIISMTLPKTHLNGKMESVILGISTNLMKEKPELNTPSIIGFYEYTGEQFYPLSFDDYSKGMPDNIAKTFKQLDFFENFNIYKSEKSENLVSGTIIYNSYPFLDGIKYDDGVHKCVLYLIDKIR